MNHDKRRTHGTHGTLAPMAIRVRTASRTLEIDWQDGLTSRWGHRLLRQRCRCAQCSAQLRSGSAPTAAPDVALIQVESCGQNALQLTFSDGHARGIFPFAYLRQLAGHDYGVTTP
jgi:DUF971 family protein